MTATRVLCDTFLPRLGLELAEQQVEQLVWLADELLRWNRTRNLTSITRAEDVVEKHLLDSLSVLPFLPDHGRLLDIGSGAGFPGLPLKIARPDLEVVSVDAVAKKIQFQRHVARTLRLQGFTALHARIEDCRQELPLRDGFDVVTARAVAHVRLLANWAAPCLRPGGVLIAMKGPEGPEELLLCAGELTGQGWSFRQEAFSLPMTRAERSLLILQRIPS